MMDSPTTTGRGLNVAARPHAYSWSHLQRRSSFGKRPPAPTRFRHGYLRHEHGRCEGHKGRRRRRCAAWRRKREEGPSEDGVGGATGEGEAGGGTDGWDDGWGGPWVDEDWDGWGDDVQQDQPRSTRERFKPRPPPRVLTGRNGVPRDEYLRPMIDPQGIAQRLSWSGKDSEEQVQAEFELNQYESREAVKFTGAQGTPPLIDQDDL